MASSLLTIIAAFLASVLLTGLVRRYLVRRRVLDIPNGRSSHSVPIPRGGSLSIVVVFLGSVLWFAYRGAISSSLGWALIGGGWRWLAWASSMTISTYRPACAC